ncbi:MAG: N-acetylglucosamine-6-phosphate deacetylase [Synergistaceae bacterium]|nr:N-acetylglucosamine-6-phosphate deacetylase [Synergistaceae bacterium]
MQNYIITNGFIFRPDCNFHTGDLYTSSEFITGESNSDAKIIDAQDLYIIPGLTDIHFHGCKGHDFCDGTIESLKAITEYQNSIGVANICPASMTLPENELTRIMKNAAKFHETCPALVGINLEGPFISRAKMGAQNPSYIIRPDSKMLARLQSSANNLIKFAVIAPEVDGAFDFINESKNIAKISIGHTACDYNIADKAFKLGAEHVTHLYNAMNGINHREPGPVISALENKNVMIELICDGIHVDPAVMRMTLKLFGDDRVIFISDSMEAAGMPDGVYELGGQKVIKNGDKALLQDNKTIAGSVTSLTQGMIKAAKFMNIKLESAVKCSAVNPAKAINLDAGIIAPGKLANFFALDKDFNIKWVMNRGIII